MAVMDMQNPEVASAIRGVLKDVPVVDAASAHLGFPALSPAAAIIQVSRASAVW